jgi:hypothetical protein
MVEFSRLCVPSAPLSQVTLNIDGISTAGGLHLRKKFLTLDGASERPRRSSKISMPPIAVDLSTVVKARLVPIFERSSSRMNRSAGERPRGNFVITV